jgi:hypothetical protein
MAAESKTLIHGERELIRDRFADFERGVLQDNIILCDAKSGILLAFAGGMVIFCVDAFVQAVGARPTGAIALAGAGLLAMAGLAFVGACHFALMTVIPRIRRGMTDHVFWESPIFLLPVDDYVARMQTLDLASERHDKLRHLHMLAGICREKFRHFLRAIRFAQVGFVALVVAELARLAG